MIWKLSSKHQTNGFVFGWDDDVKNHNSKQYDSNTSDNKINPCDLYKMMFEMYLIMYSNALVW